MKVVLTAILITLSIIATITVSFLLINRDSDSEKTSSTSKKNSRTQHPPETPTKQDQKKHKQRVVLRKPPKASAPPLPAVLGSVTEYQPAHHSSDIPVAHPVYPSAENVQFLNHPRPLPVASHAPRDAPSDASLHRIIPAVVQLTFTPSNPSLSPHSIRLLPGDGEQPLLPNTEIPLSGIAEIDDRNRVRLWVSSSDALAPVFLSGVRLIPHRLYEFRIGEDELVLSDGSSLGNSFVDFVLPDTLDDRRRSVAPTQPFLPEQPELPDDDVSLPSTLQAEDLDRNVTDTLVLGDSNLHGDISLDVRVQVAMVDILPNPVASSLAPKTPFNVPPTTAVISPPASPPSSSSSSCSPPPMESASQLAPIEPVPPAEAAVGRVALGAISEAGTSTLSSSRKRRAGGTSETSGGTRAAAFRFPVYVSSEISSAETKAIDRLPGLRVTSNFSREVQAVVTGATLKRTMTTMLGIIRGVPLLNVHKLLELYTGEVEDRKLWVEDRTGEEKWGFKLEEAIEKARKRKVLENYLILVPRKETVSLGLSEWKQLVTEAGGKIIGKFDDKNAARIIVIGDENDAHKYPKIWTQNVILDAVFKQGLELEKNRVV